MTRLEYERRRRELTQVQTAAAANVSRPILSQIERGMRTKHSSGARKLAAFFGLEVSELTEPAELSPTAREMIDTLGDRQPAPAMAGLGDSH